MVANYFTLKALVEAWRADLTGAIVGDAFSQVRDELTLALAKPGDEWMLRLSVQAPFHFIFRSEGYSKARRNVATLFEAAFDRTVTAVRIAEHDRMLYLDLDDGGCFQIMLFGPRANVFLVDAGDLVVEAFQADGEWSGRPAPEARPAPRVNTFDAFEARWRANRKTTEQAVASALPLFDRTLAAEVMHRAGVATEAPDACTPAERRALFEAAGRLRAELEAPEPRIYWRGRFADTCSLVALHHLEDHPEGLQEERFASVDEAVRVFVRRSLAQRRFRELYEPLEKGLAGAAAHYRQSAERMLEELARESRAGRYERWAHLLMAAAADVPAGADEVTLPDLFAGAPGPSVTIPLDPALSAVENAQRYYDRARRTRRAREEAEERLVDTEARAREAERLLAQLRAIETFSELEAFRKEEAAPLSRFTSDEEVAQDRIPFRRFVLANGYEVWVGRNARQNDLLTFRYAQKHDRWMHARGVPGSHAVLRLPHRQAEPGRPLLERAAAIAAYYSKAQGSSLVPVMVTERKYVRKPKGAPPGAVVVEREEVLLVEPRLPEREA